MVIAFVIGIVCSMPLFAIFVDGTCGSCDDCFHCYETFITNAEIFDGYVVDSDYNIVGTLQVKAAKPNQKTGMSKLSVKLSMLGKTRTSFKGETYDGLAEFSSKDGKYLFLDLTDPWAGSFYDDGYDYYDVIVCRNVFKTKNKVEKEMYEDMLVPWIGSLNMACYNSVLSVAVARQGKVTIKGAFDGVKVSVKSQVLFMEDCMVIPVAYSKKNVTFSFLIWLDLYSDFCWVESQLYDDAVIGKAGVLDGCARFYVDEYILDDIPFAVTEIYGASSYCYETYYYAIPSGEKIVQQGRKWVVSDGIRPAKVKYDKKQGIPVVAPGKKGGDIANPTQLKLSYKEKDGSFKGSFYVYTVENEKLKKLKASVTGVLISGAGYGTATIKKFGSWPVWIEGGYGDCDDGCSDGRCYDY